MSQTQSKTFSRPTKGIFLLNMFTKLRQRAPFLCVAVLGYQDGDEIVAQVCLGPRCSVPLYHAAPRHRCRNGSDHPV